MKKIIVFLLLIAGLYSLPVSITNAQATCSAPLPVPCTFSACGDNGNCKPTERNVYINNDATKNISCCATNKIGCQPFPGTCIGTGGTGGGTCSSGEWGGGCGTRGCKLDEVSECKGGQWGCTWDPGECNITGGFDCTRCNFYKDTPAKDNWDGQNGATCYRPENGGAACCSCLNNGQCEGAWNCVSPGTYAWECTQRAPGQICGPAEIPTDTPIPTATPVISPTPTPTSVVPSPTINPLCTCDIGDVCNATNCTFDKFTDVTYTSPLKCYLSPSLFPTPPTSKDSWCQRGLRTKGDADGSGVVNNTDYFYYVAAVNGGQIPANVNPDFNGDGEVGATDRTIVTKSLNP